MFSQKQNDNYQLPSLSFLSSRTSASEMRDPDTKHPMKYKNQKNYYVYIMASKRNGTLYIGITNDLIKRTWQHKNNLADGFTKRYKCHTLVYYEQTNEVISAIEREKQLKKWKRKWKLDLIEKQNPEWQDLYNNLIK